MKQCVNVANETELRLAVARSKLEPLGIDIALGEFDLSERHVFSTPTSLRGGTLRVIADDAGFTWNGSRSSTKIPIVGESGKEDVVFSSPTNALPPGSYLMTTSTEPLNGMPPHFIGGAQCGEEIHQLYAPGCLFDVFADDMKSAVLVNPLVGVTIEGMTVSQMCSPQKPGAAFLRLNYVADFALRDIHFLRPGPGAIWLAGAICGELSGILIDGTLGPEGVYGIVVGCVNDVRIFNSTITGARHAFTTTSSATTGITRFGTPMNVVMHDCTINVPTKEDGTSRVGLDTHAEGRYITFRDCLVNVGSGTTNVGAQTRSRDTTFDNLTIRGSKLTKGITIFGENAIVKNCMIDGAWYGVYANRLPGHVAHSHGLLVVNNIFKKTASAGIWIKEGDRFVESRNEFIGCGYAPGSGFLPGQTIRIG